MHQPATVQLHSLRCAIIFVPEQLHLFIYTVQLSPAGFLVKYFLFIYIYVHTFWYNDTQHVCIQ